MGQWLEKYGYSVYGTRGGPFKPTDWGVSTRKGNKIYLHLLKWLGDSPRLIIPDIGMEITGCRLAHGGDVTFKEDDDGYIIEFSEKDLRPVNTIIELTIKGDVMAIQPMEITSQSLSYNKPVKASTNPNPRWRGASSVNNGDWTGHFWRPGEDDEQPWIEIDLGSPEKISKVVIFESGNAINAFEIHYLSGDKWESAYEGQAVENGKVTDIPEFTAQKVRLVLTRFSDVPGIYELIFF